MPGVFTLFSELTAPAIGSAFNHYSPKRTFQLKGSTTAGAGACSAEIQASNDGTNWITIATISLVLSTVETSDGIASDAAWKHVRAELKSISGTNAKATMLLGA